MFSFGRVPLRKLALPILISDPQSSLDEQPSYIIHWYGTRYLKFESSALLYSHLSPFVVTSHKPLSKQKK